MMSLCMVWSVLKERDIEATLSLKTDGMIGKTEQETHYAITAKKWIDGLRD